jgi:FkbM family methyltransferase
MEQGEKQKKRWLKKLNRASVAARRGPLHRLLFDPLAYLTGVGHHRLIYSISQRTWKRKALTFFEQPMQLELPAGLDIYLLKAKTHDSEIRLARYMIHHLKAGDTVIDIGAHFGFFALLAAQLTGREGRVLAVEAAAPTYQLLSENLKHTPQATALHAAISDQQGTMKFYEFPALYSEYNTADAAQYRQVAASTGITAREVEVPSLTLNYLIEQEGLQPGFIKLDVEGAELRVLKGAEAWLKQGSGVLAMEYLASAKSDSTHRHAVEMLAGFGWQPHRIQADGSLQPCPDIATYLAREGLDSDNIIFRT